MMDDCSSDSSAAINLTTTCQASGVTKTGEDVAVKKLKLHCDNLDYKEFQNELNNLRILEHQNIVQFLGYCYEIQQKPYTMPDGSKVFVDDPFIALCFEYMHNGSLQKHLSAEFNGLDWDTRFKIVQGTCEGVRYIHEELQAPIYHLDLKPDNILLDKDMVPKIADFGLSRIFHEEPTRITNRPYGTPGYQPPEYIDRGEISGKFDIFSLGVIIIRIVSGPGSYPKCLYMPSDEFIDQVQKNWRKRLPATSSSDSLLGAYCHQVVTRTQIALNCVDNDSKKRPNIVSITEKLNEIETDIVKNQVEDRISGLPDHILLHILDRLDLPVVIQASTLSRRWKHLPCLLTHLLIDVSHFLPRDKNKRENCTVDQIMTTYTGVVSRLLLLSSSDNRAIERLQLSFYLADPYLRCIGHVVENVMERGNTKRLEFTIWADVPHPSYERCVLLGQRFMSFLQACPSAFRGLTSLILQNLTFGDSDIPNLLNFCTKLELLSLTYCDSVIDPVTGDDVVLMIDAPQSSLVALEISTCGYAGVHLIQMPKLQRLVCANWIGANPPLRFDNVPCLHSITLRHAALNWQRPFTLSHCLSNTTSLSIIYLNFSDQMIWIEPEDPKHLSPVFGHLRDVYFYNIFYECDLNWTMFVLEAAPSLSNFYLKLSRHPCERSKCEDSAKKVNVPWDQTSPDFKHHWLSLLEIVGFAVDEKLTKYIRLVIELAMGLKRIRLLDQEPCARCDALNDAQTTSPIRWRFPVEEEEKKVIREQLVDGISSPVEISIG